MSCIFILILPLSRCKVALEVVKETSMEGNEEATLEGISKEKRKRGRPPKPESEKVPKDKKVTYAMQFLFS